MPTGRDAARVPVYYVIDLGTLGGAATGALSINASGQVAGYSYIVVGSKTYSRAFLYSDGIMQNLGTLGGSVSSGAAVNASGQVVGYSYLAGDTYEDYDDHAFLYSEGSMTDLGTLGGWQSHALDINAAGQVVGFSNFDATIARHAFLYSEGSMVDLGTLGGTSSTANAINSSGQIVGISGTAAGPSHAFLYSGGSMSDLGTLGGTSSEARDISDLGQIVGQSAVGGNNHAFLYSGGSMIDLGTLGGTVSYAEGINASGQIVGTANDVGGYNWLAFLYMNGTMYNLNLGSRIVAGPGFQSLESANDINDRGEICGSGKYSGKYHACKLVPNALPTAEADSYETGKGVGLIVPAETGLQSNDSDSDAAAYSETLSCLQVTAPSHGTLELLGSDGSFTYTPDGGYVGDDSFEYKLNDGLEDSEAAAVVTIRVTNRAPSTPTSLNVAPEGPLCTSSLRATADGSSDPDEGDTVSYKYQWALLPGASGARGEGFRPAGPPWGHDSTDGALTDVTLHKGEVWWVHACATDGAANSPWTEPTQVTVGDAAPGAPGRPVLSPAAPRTANRITATWTAAADADGDAVTYAYQWLRDGTAVGGQSGVSSALSVTLDPAQTARGESWALELVASAGTPPLSSEKLVSAAVTILNTAPPAPPSAVIVPARPRTQAVLRAAIQLPVDADGDSLVCRYQWSKSTDGGQTWGPWRTLVSVPATQTRRGEQWRLRVRCHDGSVWSKFRFAPPVTILNSMPSRPASVMVTPPQPGPDQGLSAVGSGAQDCDGDPLSYEYQWRRSRDGGLNWSAWSWNGETLPATLTLRGERWMARARACDDEYAGGWTESAPVVIASAVASTTGMIPSVRASAALGRCGGAAIAVTLSGAARVQVCVLNAAGRQVAALPALSLPPGTRTLLWNGRSSGGTPVPPGQYLIALVAEYDGGERSRTVVPLIGQPR